MAEKDFALPAESTATNLPDEVSLSSDPTAVGLPSDSTCVFRSDQRLKIVGRGYETQDGKILDVKDFSKCKLEPGFSFYFEYEDKKDYPKDHNHHKKILSKEVNLPVEATNTTAHLLADDTPILDSAHTLELSNTSNPIDTNRNSIGVDPIVVAAVAVVAATTIAAVSISNARKSGKGKRHKGKKVNSKLYNLRQQQQKKEEEQKNCSGKSEKVQAVIDETNEILAPVEQTINNFDGIKENKELTESISDIKQEIKKLKKTIKDLE